MTDNTDKATEKTNEWQKREIGALWRREGKNQNYLSGKITIGEFENEKTFQVVVFTNKYKKQENHPDFRIYEDRPRSEESAPKIDGDAILDEISQPKSVSATEDTDVPSVLQ